MEKRRVEINPMEYEQFQEFLEGNLEKFKSSLQLQYFAAVGTFKSANRAFKRGHITSFGIIAPKRPFNNRGNTCKRKGKHSRSTNEEKKRIYEQIRTRRED